MTQKTIHDLYREGTFKSTDANHASRYPVNQVYEPVPQPRIRKGYWVGFWLGFFCQIIPGILIAWAIQSGIDRDRYIGRYVTGSIHGWIFSWPLLVFIFIVTGLLSLL